MAAWRYEFYFLVAKTIFYSLAALVRKILFCHSIHIFAPPCNILYVYCPKLFKMKLILHNLELESTLVYSWDQRDFRSSRLLVNWTSHSVNQLSDAFLKQWQSPLAYLTFKQLAKRILLKIWSSISNLEHHLWLHFQTPRRELKIWYAVEYFWWTLGCSRKWGRILSWVLVAKVVKLFVAKVAKL